jgi:hypothetical protein
LPDGIPSTVRQTVSTAMTFRSYFGARARTRAIGRTLVTVPVRIASSARRLTLHLPRRWPWESAWNNLFDSLFRRCEPIVA